MNIPTVYKDLFIDKSIARQDLVKFLLGYGSIVVEGDYYGVVWQDDVTDVAKVALSFLFAFILMDSSFIENIHADDILYLSGSPANAEDYINDIQSFGVSYTKKYGYNVTHETLAAIQDFLKTAAHHQ